MERTYPESKSGFREPIPEEKRLWDEIFPPETKANFRRAADPTWGSRSDFEKISRQVLELVEAKVREAVTRETFAREEKRAAEALLAETEGAEISKVRAEAYQEVHRTRDTLEKAIRNKDLELQKWQALAKGKTPPKSPNILELQEKHEADLAYWRSELQSRDASIAAMERVVAAAKSVNAELNAQVEDLLSTHANLEREALEQDLTIDVLENEVRTLQNQVEPLRARSSKAAPAFAPLDSKAPASFWEWLRKAKVSEGLTAQLGRCYVHGKSPLPEWQTGKLLTQAGCDCVSSIRAAEVVIVGSDGWSQIFMEGLISGKYVPSIWTQELAFAALVTGSDSLMACPPHVLRELAKTHPAIAYLMTLGFEWPVLPTEQDSDVLIVSTFSAEQSPLTVMGYHVGEAHRRGPTRRSRLTKIYTHRLAFSADYPDERKREWGMAMTPHTSTAGSTTDCQEYQIESRTARPPPSVPTLGAGSGMAEDQLSQRQSGLCLARRTTKRGTLSIRHGLM